MTPENKTEFINRLKSFLWRIGGIAAVFLLEFISQNLGLFDLPLWLVGIIGLMINELTKWLNNRGITIGGKKFGGKKII